MFSIRPSTGAFICWNIAMPRRTSASATSWGVVTMTPPVIFTCWVRVSCTSPVPGGRSSTRTSSSPQTTLRRNSVMSLVTMGPRQMTGVWSPRNIPIDMTRSPLLGRDQASAFNRPRLVLDAEHPGDARAVDVGVEEAGALAEARERQGEVGGDGRLADAALAAGDGEHAPDAGNRLRSPPRLGLRRLLADHRHRTGDARHGSDGCPHGRLDLPDDLLLRRAGRQVDRRPRLRDLDVLHHPEGHDVAGVPR